jgi:hypothetical protein
MSGDPDRGLELALIKNPGELVFVPVLSVSYNETRS